MFFNANVPGTGKMTWTRAVQVKRLRFAGKF